jgi:hypothetical protein
MLDKFGEMGGFQTILNMIESFSDEKCPLTVENLINLLEFIAKITYHFHR